MKTGLRKILLGGCIVLISAMAAAEPGAGGAVLQPENPLVPPLTRSLLISGHSLTDLAYAGLLQKLGQTEGHAIDYEMQTAPGSTLHERFHGRSDRVHEPVAKADLPAPALGYFLEKRGYDQMLVTEQHRLLDALLWDRTARSLALMARAFHAHNPAAPIYFFIPWLSLSDRDNPSAWIRYERRAHRMWLCLVHDVNRHLGTIGTRREIEPVPGALALVYLAEELSSSPMLQGFEQLPVSDRMSLIFRDDVHLTELGTLYTAMVTSAWMVGQVPELDKAWGVSAQDGQAETLRNIAAAFVENYRLEQSETQPCGAIHRWAFITHYVRYTAEVFDRDETGAAARVWRQLARAARFYWRFWNGLDADLPLTDKGGAGAGVLA